MSLPSEFYPCTSFLAELTESRPTYTFTESSQTALSPATSCSCNNGAIGQLITINGNSPTSPTSYLGCFLDPPSTTVTMSTLSPPLPSVAVEIMLNYNTIIIHRVRSYWYAFGRPYTVNPTVPASADDVCGSTGKSAALSVWMNATSHSLDDQALEDRLFPLPEQSEKLFDFSGYSGCIYISDSIESTFTSPGYINCKSPPVDRKPCFKDWRPLTICPHDYEQVYDVMVAKAWCPF